MQYATATFAVNTVTQSHTHILGHIANFASCVPCTIMQHPASHHSKRPHAVDDTELKLAFAYLDPHNTGHITHAAIKQFSTVLGLNWTHQSIKHMLKGQNSITYSQLHTVVKHIDTGTAVSGTPQHITDSYNALTANTPHVYNLANLLLNSHKLDNITENNLAILQQLCDCDTHGNMTLKTFEQLIHKPINYNVNMPYRPITGVSPT